MLRKVSVGAADRNAMRSRASRYSGTLLTSILAGAGGKVARTRMLGVARATRPTTWLPLVTDTHVARSTDRILALPERARQKPWVPFAAVMALGTVVILAGLGRSSFFIDEIFSWNASNQGWSGIVDAVQQQEVTPPLYYVILWGWIGLTGAESELALRLPSAFAGIALVGAVAWLGTTVGGRRAGVVAGLLAALSPLALQYAQEVRAYVFVMLAVTVAAAATIRLAQEPERRRWLVIACTSAGPRRPPALHGRARPLPAQPVAADAEAAAAGQAPRRRRGGGAAVRRAAAAALHPARRRPPQRRGQRLREDHARRAAAAVRTPFDGRALEGMSITYELGLLALVDAVALLAFADRFRHLRTRWMLVGACVLPLVAIVFVSCFLQPLAITRYTAVAAPFMLVVIAVVALRVQRGLGVPILALSLIAGVLGVAAMQTGRRPVARRALGDGGHRRPHAPGRRRRRPREHGLQRGDELLRPRAAARAGAEGLLLQRRGVRRPRGPPRDRARQARLRRLLAARRPRRAAGRRGDRGGRSASWEQYGGAYPVQLHVSCR